MQPKAVSKAQDVLSKLQPYMEKGATLDPFTLQRFKREVEQSLSVDARLGSAVRGVLAVFDWDELGIDIWFNRALALGDDAWTRSAYASALQLIGKYREAARQAEKASDKMPENLTYLSNAVIFAHNAGLFDKASQLVEKYNLRSPDLIHHDTQLTRDAYASISALGIAPDLAERCNAVAFEILRTNRVSFRDTAVRFDREDYTMMFNIGLTCPAEQVERLDDELGVALYERISDFDPGKYWVGYEKTTTL